MTSYAIVVAAGAFFLAMDTLSGSLKKTGVFSLNEMGVNLLSFANFVVIRGLAMAFWTAVLFTAFRSKAGFLSDANPWIVFPIFVLIEEYIHYWIHRWSHSVPWLWRIHKPHHVPQHVNLAVAYLENWIWFLLLPNAFLTAFMIWAGLPEVAFVLAAWKGASEFMVHSATRWDLPLHEFRLTRPIMRVLEKVITLPDTHHAHHGIGKYGHGMCNFGSFLFIFDVLHGTAEFPHHAQEAFGVPKSVKVEPWYEQLWWPFGKAAQAADLHPPSRLESQLVRTFGNDRFTITM